MFQQRFGCTPKGSRNVSLGGKTSVVLLSLKYDYQRMSYNDEHFIYTFEEFQRLIAKNTCMLLKVLSSVSVE